jgi:hypothetical protein
MSLPFDMKLPKQYHRSPYTELSKWTSTMSTSQFEHALDTSSPLLIFVLGMHPRTLPIYSTNFLRGAPCSDKSTLCTTLAVRYGLEHFSANNEMRDSIKPNRTGLAALIKPTFNAEEIAEHIRNVKANTLTPVDLTPKHVKERPFGVGA